MTTAQVGDKVGYNWNDALVFSRVTRIEDIRGKLWYTFDDGRRVDYTCIRQVLTNGRVHK